MFFVLARRDDFSFVVEKLGEVILGGEIFRGIRRGSRASLRVCRQVTLFKRGRRPRKRVHATGGRDRMSIKRRAARKFGRHEFLVYAPRRSAYTSSRRAILRDASQRHVCAITRSFRLTSRGCGENSFLPAHMYVASCPCVRDAT